MRPITCWLVLALCAGCGGGTPAVDAAALPDLAAPVDGADQAYAQAILGAPWSALPGSPTVTGGAKQDDLYFTSPLRGFAVSGPKSAIFGTTDGGATWTMLFSHPGTYFRSILFADDNHGFASNLGPLQGTGITDPTVLYETKDGGATWAPVTAISGPMPAGICNQTKVDAQNLIAVGRVNGPAYLMRSSDGGASWTSIDLRAQLSMLIDARFTTPMDGMVIGRSPGQTGVCTILRTGDGGQSWSSAFSSATPNSLCWKISFPSAEVGYVSVQDLSSGPPTFAKTSDGGQTWTEKPLAGDPNSPYPGIGIGFITEQIGWVSSEDPTLPTYRTADGGETWQEDSALKSPINRFRFLDANTSYAIGATVWKLHVPWGGG